MMHTLLRRQLKRYVSLPPEALKALAPFLSAVSAAYESSDDDQQLLVHSLDVSSSELRERYEAVRQRDVLFRTSADMLCVLSPDLSVTEANGSFSRVLGWSCSAMAGLKLDQLVHPEDRELFDTERKKLDGQQEVATLPVRCRTQAGAYRVISWSMVKDPRSGAMYVIGRDITEERERESARSQTEKLEMVGQLAAGMAHEINSPVQFIGDNLSFLADSFKELLTFVNQAQTLMESSTDGTVSVEALRAAAAAADLPYLQGEIPRSTAESREGVRRVAELIRALKEFAHPDAPEMLPSDINKSLERSLVLVRSEIRYAASIEARFAPLPYVECQLGAVSQVFVNLVINAAHAIEDRKGQSPDVPFAGKIKVSTYLRGERVAIAITDNGVGIADDVRPRIFEPFFTTKAVGRGSGQGLTLVRSIVKRHNGEIEIESKVGEGTTMTVLLPVKQPLSETP
ncbi:MAG: PAS domain S-box protein [Myxococcaceae bacterium]|nr:PAS domain S-box protein [Myxococcaceae bacterium]